MSACVRKFAMTWVVCLIVMATVHGLLLESHTIAVYHFHGTAPDTTLVTGPLESVVGPGTEFADFGFSGFVDIDVSDTTILITLKIDQPFGYSDVLRITDPNGTIPNFTGVTVNPETNYAGFDASRVQVGANFIDVNLTGLQGLQGQQISLAVTGSSTPPPPETVMVVLDIQPDHCANALRSTGMLQVAIRGSASVDVAEIDRASIRLEGVAPRRSRIADTGGTDCAAAVDGVPDLLLTFKADAILAALGAVTDGETRVLSLTGELGGLPIRGDDSVVVQITRGKKR